jgi:hypothetical protein
MQPLVSEKLPTDQTCAGEGFKGLRPLWSRVVEPGELG